MPYYRYPAGDYRTYGYGQGDPGFLSSLWKGIKKVAAPAIGFALGGPAGLALAGALGGAGKMTPPIMAPRAQPRQQIAFRAGPIAARSTDYYPPVPQFAGTAMPGGMGSPGRAVATDATGCCPVGFHMAKSGPPRCVRNRRMNVANPRALRRSMRRVQGFEKLAKRTISFTRRVKMKK